MWQENQLEERRCSFVERFTSDVAVRPHHRW
jgi:hypothetical protein